MVQGQKYKVKLNLADSNDARIIAYHFVEEGASVLDVGCACGDFGVLLNKAKSCRMHGLDYDSHSLAIASKTECYQYLEQADLNVYEVKEGSKWLRYFDCITFLDVLEHLVAPRDCLTKLLNFLKPGGDVVVSLPNLAFGDIKLGLMNDEFFYSTTGILDNTHLRFFTYKSIASFLAESELIVVDVGFKLSGFDSKLKSMVDDALLLRVNSDPHSFVYQYVMRCKRSDLSTAELTAANMGKLNISLMDIRPRLLMLGAREVLAAALPPSSKLRRILRKAVALLRVGRR